MKGVFVAGVAGAINVCRCATQVLRTNCCLYLRYIFHFMTVMRGDGANYVPNVGGLRGLAQGEGRGAGCGAAPGGPVEATTDTSGASCWCPY